MLYLWIQRVSIHISKGLRFYWERTRACWVRRGNCCYRYDWGLLQWLQVVPFFKEWRKEKVKGRERERSSFVGEKMLNESLIKTNIQGAGCDCQSLWAPASIRAVVEKKLQESWQNRSHNFTICYLNRPSSFILLTILSSTIILGAQREL